MKTKQPLLSIILPIYGVEKYISSCLDSLIQQTLGIENIEIICVNDCTPDYSMTIVQEYADKSPDSFVLIDHEENMGPGGARNTGLRHAQGKYITFVDPDDYIDHDTYKYILSIMEDDEQDLTLYDFSYFTEKGKSKEKENISKELFSHEYTIDHSSLPDYPQLIFALSVWNKVIRRDLSEKLQLFPEHQLYNEDARFSFDAITQANNILITNAITYHYRKRAEQVSSTDKHLTDPQAYFDHLKHHKYLEKQRNTNKNLILAIDWYHIEKLYPFLHNILMEKVNFTQKQYITFITESIEILRSVDSSRSYPHMSITKKNMLTVMQKDLTPDQIKKTYRKSFRLLRFHKYIPFLTR